MMANTDASPDERQTNHVGKNGNSRTDRQFYANTAPDNNRQTTESATAYCNQDEDDDSECWDDAKALLDNDDGDMMQKHHHQMEFDTIDGATQSQAERDSSIFQPASTSSAYSSLQSSTVMNTATTTTTTTGSGGVTTTNNINLPASASPATSADDLILHKAIFDDDRETILAILNDTQLIKQRELVNKRDKHGNTALHLACILGRPKEIIALLLQNNRDQKWSIDTKNLNRWTPFHEACSYGNREVICLMAKQLKDDVDDALRNSKLSNFLEKTKDYRLVLKWEFQSWVPFVSRVLPSDTCVINKQGKFIRIDTRLLDFEGWFRKKGNCCLVYSNGKWIVMNNRTKKYQYFETPTAYKDLENRVDEFMSTDIMDLELKSSEMQLTRSTSGWIWKADKVGKVGRFNAALYDFTNVFLVTRKRREHLSEEDLKRNKLAYKSAVHMFKFGEKPSQEATNGPADQSANDGSGDDEDSSQSDEDDDDEEEVVHRESLPPPPPTNVTWQEYISSEPGNHQTLGREQQCKVSKTAVKASVAMSEEFPLTKKEFLDLLSIIPIKMFKKLKEFVELKLPEGFPVRLDIPVFPFLTARITFEDFAFHEGPIEESLFTIPDDYEEDLNLLPGRFKGSANKPSNSNNGGTTLAEARREAQENSEKLA